MIGNPLSLLIGLLLLSQAPGGEGSIDGLVLNDSRGGSPVGSAEVLLRVNVDGEFLVVAQATSDANGRFLFEGLPIDQGLVYLPGSSREGVHYSGPRIPLSASQPNTHVVVRVRDASSEPNPLVIRDYELVLEPGPGTLHVSEKMLIENPGLTTYIGQGQDAESEPVTLQLGIASEFERVTFNKEFYGRQFSLNRGKLVTSIPWTPGQHELQFSYTLRNDERNRTWVRPLDLPCRHVRLTVRAADAKGVTCNLGTPSIEQDGVVTFESQMRDFPAGDSIRVEMSRLPISVMAYARWIVLALLTLVVAGSIVVLRRLQRPRQWTEPKPTIHRRASRERARA